MTSLCGPRGTGDFSSLDCGGNTVCGKGLASPLGFYENAQFPNVGKLRTVRFETCLTWAPNVDGRASFARMPLF